MILENLTKICVIVLTFSFVLMLEFCCVPKSSKSQLPTLLNSVNSDYKKIPCEIEGRNMYYYVKGNEIGRLRDYIGYDDIKDSGGILYDDGGRLHPFLSYIAPFDHIWPNFAIYNEGDKYVVYYFKRDKKRDIEKVYIEKNPFKKKVIIKPLDKNFINELYLKNAMCFM